MADWMQNPARHNVQDIKLKSLHKQLEVISQMQIFATVASEI